MDADEFAEQAVGLHERVARAAMAMCGDRSIAEECAGDALLRAWERVDAGEELRSLEAWTMTVALNGTRSRLRRRGTELRLLEREATMRPTDSRSADPESAGEHLGEQVRHAVLGLPERQREVVVLHYLDDMSTEQIAVATHSSANSVRNALHHGRKALARVLVEQGTDQEGRASSGEAPR